MLKKFFLTVCVVGFVGVITSVIVGFANCGGSHSGEPVFNSFQNIEPVTLPDTLFFAGESVPLKNFDTRESLDREMLVNSYWHSQTIYLLKLSGRFFPVIEPILKKEGLPADFKYLALAESGLQQLVSPSKAVGVWQLLESSAKEEGLEVTPAVDERYDIEKATIAACSYLRKSKDLLGSWTMAAAAYNFGRTGMRKQIERQGTGYYYDLTLGEETGRYVFRILALKLIFEHPERYGFVLDSADFYAPLRYTEVTVDSSISRLADFAAKEGTNYKMLKYFNPWLRDSFLPNVKHKSYSIKIPVEGYRTNPYNK
jgi:Transglycosylase SLT domain.